MRRLARAGIASVLLVMAAGSSRTALAADPGPSQAAPPDLVRLRSGSLYRGTILELVVGDHVDVRLASGETKRFAASDIEYAGPASAAPGAAPPPPPPPSPVGPRPMVTVDGASAPVRFESTTPDTDFHLRTEDATAVGWTGRGAYLAVARSYSHICAAPCEGTLPVGRQRLALSLEGGVPVEPDEAVIVPGPSTVRGTYVSNRGTRVAGWLVFLGSLTAGTAMMVLSIQHTQDCSSGYCMTDTSTNSGLLGAGAGVVIAGSLLSLALIFQRDHVSMTVTPINAGSVQLPSLARREGAWLAPESSAPGLGLTARF